MIITIGCPSCDGTGIIKKLQNKVCDYCHGRKNVPLTKHLEVLKRHDALSNVLHFQKRQNKKQHNDNRRKSRKASPVG
jgi:DnaJ-class molecular chaperone